MHRKNYAVGDAVKLKADLFRRAAGNESCRIVAILPADHGETQYRVRIGDETCERRILASDIEAPEAAVRRLSGEPRPPAGSREPWLKASSIRIKK